MQAKKLMFYINTLGTGGAERVLVQLAGCFQGQGCEVTLVTSYPVEGEYPIPEGVRRITLESEGVNGSRLLRNVSRIAKLRKLCIKYRPDLLISFMQEPNFRAVIAAMGLPVKTLISVRNDPTKEYPGKLGRFVGRVLLPLADGCVFQTEQAKSWFPRRLQKKSVIILNEVAEQFFHTQWEPEGNIITMGRLNLQKNHELLIRAFAKIASRHPQQNLLIYGKGDRKVQLEQLICQQGLSDRVFLMGTTTQVHTVLSRAGVFVLSSDYEGMPNALMEALAVGVPSISTDCPCGGPKMLIHHERNGLLVPVRDVDAMAEAMDRLLSDPMFARRLGETAHEQANQYLPEKIFGEWEQYVDHVIHS